MARRDPFPVSLGIEGLPPASAQMEPDAAYAVGVPLPHALPALVCGMAARALLDRRPVTLVCGSDTAEIVRRLTAHGLDAPAEMAAGRLVVLQLSDSLDTKLGHFGASRVIEELEYFCKPRGRLLILAPAEQLLVANNPRLAARQAELYARWCTASRAAAVFVFSGNSVASACARQAVDGWFAGVARMSGDGLRLNWQVEHWRSPEGSIGSREYGISVAHDGALLVADGGLRSSSLKIVEAPDYDTVLAVAAAVRHEKSRPAHWQLVGGHEALLTRASSAVAATFILDCGPEQDMEELAKTVHHLRIHAGNGIKIVVRERGRRLRYNQEMLLNRLGANAIADSTLSFSRFLSLLDSLRDRSYDREVAPVFEEAVLQAVPPEQQGYLPAREFVMAVREAVARSALLGVQCALLQLVINPQQAHLDVLKRIRIGRPGDLFTADDRCVYLFLFACREPDIDTALNRMVGMAQTELFDAQLRNADQDSINVALLALERHLRLSSPVDYSALLATPAAAPAPAPAAAAVPAPEPTIAVPREYQVLAMPAAPPRTAVREPLPVRT